MSDIFISYRRNGGSDRAHLVYNILTQAGYDVFMDLHGIAPGANFQVAFEKELRNCKDYVLILSKNIFQTKRDEDNVIKEIQIALSENKNFLIVSPGPNFWENENTPQGIPDFDKLNYVPLNHDKNFESSVLGLPFKSKMSRTVTYRSKRFNIGLEIKASTIFEQDGIHVIHCMDDFEHDPKVIFPTSVFGQFLTCCEQQCADVDALIKKHLANKKEVGRYDYENRKSVYYPTGTTLRFSIGEEEYRIVAFNHWNKEEKIAPYTVAEYKSFLKQLWENMKEEGKNSTINITLMGNNFTTFAGEVPPNTEQKIWMILESVFDAARNGFKCNKLRICIYENDIEEIKFSDLKTIIRYLDER